MADPLAVPTARMRAVLAEASQEAADLVRAGAEAGLPEAQVYYGQILLDGRGVEPDPEGAVRWFRKAADAGDLMALNMLGRCHENGWGVDVDRAQATALYRRAAEGGLDWGMYNYASALGLGAGADKDEAAAFHWFSKAAALGHAKSINFVGAFHEEGRLAPLDMDKAKACYRTAAEAGDFRGQFNLARRLASEGRIDEALAWIGRARAGAPPAFLRIMRSYLAASVSHRLRAAAADL